MTTKYKKKYWYIGNGDRTNGMHKTNNTGCSSYQLIVLNKQGMYGQSVFIRIYPTVNRRNWEK